jgi:hypothetical protein
LPDRDDRDITRYINPTTFYIFLILYLIVTILAS